MTVVTKQVAVGTDDGSFDAGAGTGYSNTGTNFVVGDASSTVYNKTVFLRFTGLAIPQGATITAASLSIPATGGSVTPLQTVHIRAEAADNPAAVTSRADGVARVKTTAQTSWSGMTAISTGSYTTADFTAVVQEVVNRAGWASGNAMQLFLSSDTTTFGTAWQIAFATFNSATSSPATLSVTYADPNTPPTANAGADQVNVDAFSTVTLNGSGSSDPDGTIASYAWTQTGGTSVTLSGTGATRTFTAPATLAGDTLMFSLTVTDNGGATSTADTMTVTVLPHTEWLMTSGGLTAIHSNGVAP